MIEAGHREISRLKVVTAETLAQPVNTWLDRVKGETPEVAMACLALFMGHMLAACAQALGVAGTISIEGTTDVVSSTLRDELLERAERPSEGTMLQ